MNTGILTNTIIKASQLVATATDITEPVTINVSPNDAGRLFVIELASGSVNFIFDEQSLPIGSTMELISLSGDSVDLLRDGGADAGFLIYDTAGSGPSLSLPTGSPVKTTITSLGAKGIYVTFS